MSQNETTPTPSSWPAGVLDQEKTLQVLTEHAAWRRGADEPQTDPRLLTQALEAAIAVLAVCSIVPPGWAQVPARMELTPENMERLAFMLGGDPDAKDADERWNGGTLWIGETIGDHGEKYYGLNVANVECYDEGSMPIIEFVRPEMNPAEFPRWRPISTAPLDTKVLLWSNDTGEISIGHKPSDAPASDCVIVDFTASYADAWHALPADPEASDDEASDPA